MIMSTSMNEDERYMARCIQLARHGRSGAAPNPMVGAVIVHESRIIGEGYHIRCGEAHAEVNAIRSACVKMGTFNLSGCVLYTSCEPCPMCLGAIYWAHIDKIYYGATQYDAAAVDFDDSFIYRELELKPAERNKPVENILHNEALAPFDAWRSKADKVEY